MPDTPDSFDRRQAIKSLLAASLAAGLAPGKARSQPPPPSGRPSLSRDRVPAGIGPTSCAARSWPAHWITHPDSIRDPEGVYCFRSVVALDSVPSRFRVRVSADQRFKFYVNGALIGTGPAAGDAWHWRYETFDLAPVLRPGANVLAAVVWFGMDQNVGLAQMGVSPGFVLSPDEEAGTDERWTDQGEIPPLATGSAAWRVLRNPGHSFLPISPEDAHGYCVIGPMDRLDGGKIPWGWMESGFEVSDWPVPLTLERARPRDFNDGPGDAWHYLEPSPIPPLEIVPEPLGRVVRVEGIEAGSAGPQALKSSPVVIPAGTNAKILIDHRIYTTALIGLEAEGGAGATVRVRYAEALFDAQGEKGNRDRIEGKRCRGYADEIVLDGFRRQYEPLYWRAFRFVQIEVQSAGTPVSLHALTIRFTGAPLAPLSAFDASDPALKRFWEVGVRTVRCNAHDTFTDGPYWEQLSYPGDSRLSCLTALAFAGRRAQPYVRNALGLFDASRMPDGLTQSRYPSRKAQIIPPYSLWFVAMLHDYWMYSDAPDDAVFVGQRLTGVTGILDWFLRRLNPQGLLGPLPWWNFVDWSFRHGVPPGGTEREAGGSSVLTLQLILALQAAAAMEQALGRSSLARNYRDAADEAAAAVRSRCWDPAKGLIADVPLQGAATPCSQHATALAILAGVLLPGENTRAARQLLELAESESRGVTRATLYFRYYVGRALVKSGYGDRYLEWMGPWREALALGLTTWPEVPGHSRSDCHGWSAHPTREFLATILGIESAAPGFRAVTITPHLGPLSWASGVQAHPRGEIRVNLRRSGDRLDVDVAVPPAVTATIRRGASIHSFQGRFQGSI